MKRIILNGDEVRQVLETGRVVVRKPVNLDYITEVADGIPYFEDEYGDHHKTIEASPLGQPGDKVWVGETFALTIRTTGPDALFNSIWFMADRTEYRVPPICYRDWERMVGEKFGHQIRPAISMPQWASRLTLEIVSVKVERGDKWEWVYELEPVQKQEGVSL